ncbi:ferredoxin [Candidatus Aenigmatarchaeota archaeon]
MAKFKIQHDRPNCIGCGACTAVAPDLWKMNDSDGKSDLIGSKDIEKDGNKTQELDLDDIGKNKEAADCCPVNVIHITDLENNKKII